MIKLIYWRFSKTKSKQIRINQTTVINQLPWQLMREKISTILICIIDLFL